MSSPAAAPAGSPPESTTLPPSSSAPPTSSSSPPPSDQSPPAPPPSVPSSPPPPPPPVSSPSPPAPPPESPTTPSQDSSPPPAESPPPPPVSSSPPPPVQDSSPPPGESPPSPVSSSAPEQSPPSPAQSPPPPAVSPPPPRTTLSPPPPSASPPPPGSSSALSPPPPPASTSTPTTSSSSPSPSSTVSTGTLVIIVVAAVFAVSVLLVLLLCFCKKKKKRHYYSGDHHGPPGGLPAHYKDSYYDPNTKQQQGWHSPYSSQSSEVLLNMPPPPPPPPFMISEHDLASPKGNAGASPGIGNSKSWFTYAELAAATNGFSKANMLGEGGFGCVYKGVLSNGQVVAVKQLKSGASQGEKEFQAEVEIISRVHHRHLVSLVGYCIADSQRLLVYDFVSNDTLEHHLHKKKGGPPLDWPTRLKTASGAARGLAYLHEDCHPRIIHRDIKSANILLDDNFDAQVSDFGLAKLTSDANTHVTTRVMGTFGYLAPEYASSGKLTEKSDVFSFGVVLLELLTGRKPVDVLQPPGQESLVEWARPILAQIESEDDLEMLVDPALNGVYDPKETLRMAEAAAACVRHSAHKRPRMGQVVRALEDEISLADLNKGLKPGHSSVYGSSFSSSEYEHGSYSADIRRFRMALNENNDTGNAYSSSEYQTSREIDQGTRRPMRMQGNTAFSSSNEFI